MKHKEDDKGFTVVELIVVIVVLGIVSGFIYNNIRNAQAQAQATFTVNTLKSVEKGLYLKAIDEGITEWWHENTYEACAGTASTSPNPPIDGMITNCGLDTYLQSNASDNPYENIIYDADGNQFTGCGAGSGTGVNIRIDVEVPTGEFEVIDAIVDDGDGSNCGVVRQGLDLKIHYLMGANLDAFVGG